MNQEWLKFGYLSLRPVDILDILLVSAVFYWLWKLSRNTRASRMWLGILLLLALGMLARFIDLRALSWILASLSAFWAVAFVILFQPELRRALSEFGRTPWSRKTTSPRLPEILTNACIDLTARKWGAIFVIRRKNTVNHYIETGISLYAETTSELFVNIFAPGTPLHDGAVIIDGDRIAAARCVLPVVEEAKLALGMRHRAALGASLDTDAIVVVVSEETGMVSIAVEGEWQSFRITAQEMLPIVTRVFSTRP